MINCSRLWRQVWWASTPRKRIRIARVAAGSSAESLEQRCLLSAAMSTGAESAVAAECDAVADQPEAKLAKVNAKSTPRKTVVPSIAGTWTYTLHVGTTDIVGTLELSQKGKKVTGTLTREFQDPGDLKGKLKVVKPVNGPKLEQDYFALFGKIEDVSVASKSVRFGFNLIFLGSGSGYDFMEGTVDGPDGEVPAEATRNHN